MPLRDIDDLRSFHDSFLSLRDDYKPPYPLMEKVNSEYRAYMEKGIYYTWLALATRILKPKRILELGNYHGSSTIMTYSELSDNTQFFYSVDVVRDLAFVPEKIFADKRINFRFGNDLNLSIYGQCLPTGLDFVFIDTLHEYRQLKDEWKIYKNLCNPNAVVVLDDILLNDMPKFWAELPYPKLDISKDCHESGFGVFLYQPEEKEVIPETEMAKRAYIAALDVAHQYVASYQQVTSKLPSLREQSVRYARTLLNRQN